MEQDEHGVELDLMRLEGGAARDLIQVADRIDTEAAYDREVMALERGLATLAGEGLLLTRTPIAERAGPSEGAVDGRPWRIENVGVWLLEP